MPTAALAQAGASYPATASTRFIDAERLAAEPPKGIPEFSAALKALAIEFAPLEAGLLADARKLQEIERRRDALKGGGKTEEMTRLADEYEAGRRDLLRRRESGELLYATRSKQIVQPITERIREASRRFGQLRGFADLRFAQPEDLAPFAQAGAREVTADFVSWYAQNIAR